MDSGQIARSLNATFRQLRDKGFGARALVFWYDERRDFEEAFDALTLEGGVEKLRLDDAPFRTKYHLLVEKPETSFLLYAPFGEPPHRENWLLDLQVQAEVFSADPATILLGELGLRERGLQHYLRQGYHLTFFRNKDRAAALKSLELHPDATAADLRLAMMCALARLKAVDASQLIRALLSGGLSEPRNELYGELVKYFEPDELWEVVERCLGYRRENPSLRDLFISLSLTHLQQQLNGRLPEALSAKVIASGTRAYVFVDQWLRHVREAAGWNRLSEEVAEDLNIGAFARALDPEDYLSVETFQAFDDAFIQAGAKRLTRAAPDPQPVKRWLAARKALHWFEHYRARYETLEAACDLLQAVEEAPDYAEDVDPLWKAYAARHYLVDRHYRRFVAALGSDPEGLQALAERIDNAYTHGFLEPLSEAWSNALASTDKWGIVGAYKQWRFFDQHVKPILQKSDREKVFVIVSDALRYEVATELKEALGQDLRGSFRLTVLQSVLPSITKLGMAALLPGETIQLDAKGAILKGGRPAQSTEQRQAILSGTGYSSACLQIGELLAMNRDDGRELVQAHRLFYIYQNVIDAIGDKAATEQGVFDACAKAVGEIHKAVRKIVNQLNGTHVLVTSDHGFLYQRQPLQAHNKLKPPEGALVDSGRRHALGRSLGLTDGTQGFGLPFLEPGDMVALSPRGILRYALQGPGSRYVHGGSSLQETCVPLLSYRHQRAVKGDDGPSHKVGVRVSATTRRVTNNTFTVRLIQDEPIGGRVKPRRIAVKFADVAGTPVTNTYPLLLESNARQATDREFIARLTIGVPHVSRENAYYLVVTDVDDDLEILRETWQIDLAFTDDFGDF